MEEWSLGLAGEIEANAAFSVVWREYTRAQQQRVALVAHTVAEASPAGRYLQEISPQTTQATFFESFWKGFPRSRRAASIASPSSVCQ